MRLYIYVDIKEKYLKKIIKFDNFLFIFALN